MPSKRRKGKYTTNPITGKRERVLRSDEYRDPFSGKVKRNRRSTRRKSNRSKKQDVDPLVAFIMMIGLAAAILYYWATNYPIQFWTVAAIIIGGIALVVWKVPRLRPSFIDSLIHTFKPEQPIRDDEIAPVVQAIEEMKLERVRNEEDFEKQLIQWLRAKGFTCERQVHVDSRSTVDIVVEERIALELKIADRTKSLRDLIGQVTVYKEHYEKVIAVILDYGKVEDLPEYAERIKNVDSSVISVLVMGGEVKRPKRKDQYFMVRQSTTYQ